MPHRNLLFKALGALFGSTPTAQLLEEKDPENIDRSAFWQEVSAIPILHEAPPDLTKYEEMPYMAIDAYSYQIETGTPGAGDFSGDARHLAVRTVAAHYKLTEEHVVNEYDVIIIPGFGYHGKILAKRKDDCSVKAA